MPPYSTGLIQSALHSQNLSAIESPHLPKPMRSRWYFTMELLDPSLDDSQVNWNVFDQEENDVTDEYPVIAHGRAYQLQISASTSSDLVKLKPVLISTPVKFRLFCSATVTMNEDSFIISPDEVSESYTRLINISVPDECSTGVAKFVMLWHESGKQPSIAAELAVKMDGTYKPDLDTRVDKEFAAATKVKLDEVLPEQTAIMHIVAKNSGVITVKGWNRRAEKLNTDLPAWDPIRLSDFTGQNSQISPKEVRQRVTNFSRTKIGPEFIRWLKVLRERFHSDLCLIISDDTDLETPWEMLELEDEEYLGAMVKVCRWLPVRYFDEWSVLKVSNVEKQGTILSYLDDKDLGLDQTYLERQALKVLKRRECKNSTELLNMLGDKGPSSNVGLIYLGCHGYDGMSFGSRYKLDQRITVYNLEIPFRYPEPRPIVFVNACESARIRREGQDYFKGLLEIFLARFASGYIGTLGKVGSVYASTVASRILEDASKVDGIQIAEVLRRLKAEAAKAVKEDESVSLSDEERQKREVKFLYAFMYVFYGNALMHLRLMLGDTTEQGGIQQNGS